MVAPSLPPRGIFVPTTMIFNSDLPAAVLVSWIQLRCLAWRGWATPPYSIPELAALLGIHPNRLEKHLAHLKDISALSYRHSQGKLILSFPESPGITDEDLPLVQNPFTSPLRTMAEREIHPPTSYFPAKILGYISYEEDEKDPLYVEPDQPVLERFPAEQAHEFSKPALSRQVEHSLVAK